MHPLLGTQVIASIAKLPRLYAHARMLKKIEKKMV
jgi:hypothetical protein